MCFTSVVMDQWSPYIPNPNKWVPNIYPYNPPPFPLPNPPSSSKEFTHDELRKFLDAFHQAIEAAKIFDRLTDQPDCVDPEKAKLEERVADLEARLAELEETHE